MPHQQRDAVDLQGAQPDALPEDPRRHDFYFGADDFDFPLGHIQMLGKSDRHILRGGAPRLVPGYALDYIARHAVDFWLTTEDLPNPDNRVTLERDGTIRVSYGNKTSSRTSDSSASSSACCPDWACTRT